MNEIAFNYQFSGVSDSEMQEHVDALAEYSFPIDILSGVDIELLEQLASSVESKGLKYVIVAGIGGSNLGAKAVYDALFGQFDFLQDRTPKIIFLDTVSPTLLRNVFHVIDSLDEKEEVLVNVISKSGSTAETMAHFEALEEKMTKIFGDVSDRFVLTTGEGSKLWQIGKEKGMHLLPMPEEIGGRFSVFTNVGLFPLLLAGVDVQELVAGANAMLDRAEESKKSAACIFSHKNQGILLNNSFFFNPECESIGKWYRQLMGESVGKRHDLDGNEVFAGITPIVSIGSTDLHSMAQLYFGGPRNKFTALIYASQSEVHEEYARIMDAIYGGVVSAYKNNELPFVEVDLQEISAYSIGQFFQFKMMEMMYLAKLMNVNAFDQPSVEDYKSGMRELLKM